MRKLLALALCQRRTFGTRSRGLQQLLKPPPSRSRVMRKLLALALLALAVAGGVAFVSVEHSTPAAACTGNNC